MPSRYDYTRQAQIYDRTRGATPAIVGPVLDALADLPGQRVLDVGGGTGNYSLALRGAGFEPVVVDVSADMLARAAAKGLETVEADAMALPFGDASADAVLLISMLHHVSDWRLAVAEARRVARPSGKVVLMGYAREHVVEVGWMHEYFPEMAQWLVDRHAPLADYAAELPGAQFVPIWFEDAKDLSNAALSRQPELLLDPDLRAGTSFFEALADRDPVELEAGARRLEEDLKAGRRPQDERDEARARWGDAGLLVWTQPYRTASAT